MAHRMLMISTSSVFEMFILNNNNFFLMHLIFASGNVQILECRMLMNSLSVFSDSLSRQ